MSEQYVVVCDQAEGRDKWLEARKLGIGASDMPVILGLSPWKSILELHSEKTGETESEDLSDNEFIKWGNRLELPILQAYAEETGRPANHSGHLIRSIEHPWAQCTLDGITGADDHPLEGTGFQYGWPLQIKNTSAFKADDWADGPPEQYVVQEHHEMLVTGAQKATIACLLGGNRLVWADVERNEILIKKIIHHGEAFWRRVLDRRPPPPDGSEATKKALSRLHPRDNGKIVELAGDLRGAVESIRLCKAAIKEEEGNLRHWENQIKAAMGDNQAACFAGGGPTITWRSSERAGYTVKPSTIRTLRIKGSK